MLCERCNKKKATVHYRENLSGRTRLRRLCPECAEVLESAGELEEMSAALASYASPFFRVEEGAMLPLPRGDAARTRAISCPSCGMTGEELATQARAGCARCYAVFEDELTPAIRAMHGRLTHVGHVTAAARARRERMEQLAQLKKQMKEAVAVEEFERAAELRDLIRTLDGAGRVS